MNIITSTNNPKFIEIYYEAFGHYPCPMGEEELIKFFNLVFQFGFQLGRDDMENQICGGYY